MKKKNTPKQFIAKKRLTRLGMLGIAACWLLITGTLVYIQRNSFAQSATAKVSATPSSGTFDVGQTITVNVQIELNAGYNAVSTNLYYNKNTMTYVSTSLNNTSFNGTANTIKHDAAAGYIALYDNRTSGGSLKGTHRLATVTFKAKSAGSGYAKPTESKVVEYPVNSYTAQNVNANYTIKAPAPQPVDVCPNIGGVQTSVPAGYVKDGNGNCVVPAPQPVDVCPNIGGVQTSVPAGYVKDGNGNCVVPAPQRPPATSTPSNPIEIFEDYSYEGWSTEDAPTSSEASESGLQINDLSVGNLGYRTATITWTTTKPVESKINYSTDPDDLSNEQRSDDVKTNHSIQLDPENLRAGTRYYIRVTAEDENGPVTVDNEFDTPAIPVIIKVTDEGNQPLVGVEVSVNNETETTNDIGEVGMKVPEGEVQIYAQKDDLSRDIYATVKMPEGEVTEENVQRITLSLSKDQSKNIPGSKSVNKKSIILIPIAVILLIAGVVVAFLFWKKKRGANQPMYTGDPLEAENYTTPVIPSTPLDEQHPIEPTLRPELPQATIPVEPVFTELENPVIPHHATLPEMTGRYGQPMVPLHPTAEDSNEATHPEIPHYTSLKDMVSLPRTDDSIVDELNTIPTDDLPVAPTQSEDDSIAFPPVSTQKESTIEEPDDDGQITIRH